MSSSAIRIRRAERADATDLTRIAHAAKRHWNYPEEWIRAWREQLTLTADYLESQRVFVAADDGLPVGFYALVPDGPVAELDHLWVDPVAIGTGLGRRLIEHAMEQSRSLGVTRIEIDADPQAESFYRHMGARVIGRTAAPVGDDPGRYLPRLLLEPGPPVTD